MLSDCSVHWRVIGKILSDDMDGMWPHDKINIDEHPKMADGTDLVD